MQTQGVAGQAGPVIVEAVRRTGEQLIPRRRCVLQSNIVLHEPLVEYAAVIRAQRIPIHVGRGGQRVAIIRGIQMDAQADLSQIAEAIRPMCRRLGVGQSRQQQRRKDANDRNYH